MNRRNFMISVSSAMMVMRSMLSRATATTSLDKKGVTLGKQWTVSQLESLNPKWYYSWNLNSVDTTIPFTPMVWGRNDVQKIKVTKPTGTALLGFNEPDNAAQSFMTTEEAIAAWPILESVGCRLGSPAVARLDTNWLTTFMTSVEKKKLRVDFVTLHWYGLPDASIFLNTVKSLYNAYGRPVWITEFAAADWGARDQQRSIKFSDKNVQDFMNDVIPVLEGLSYVEKYAWYSTATINHPALGRSAMFDPSNNLTPLGEQYANVGHKE